MRVLPDGWSVGPPILARRAPGAIAETQTTRDAALGPAQPQIHPKAPAVRESAGMIGR